MEKFNTSPAYSIPKSNRKNLHENENQIGPGQYNYPETNIIKQNTQKTVFGKSLRQNKKLTQTPGPGLYNTQANIKIKGTYFTQTQKKNKQINDIGPGSYNVQQNKNNKGVVFSTAKNDCKTKNSSPGPGQYYKPELYTDFKKLSNKAGFSTSPRMKQLNINQPGPGQYETQSNLNKHKNQTFSKTSRLNIKKDFTPGYIYDTFIKNLSNKGGYITKQSYDNKKSSSQIPFYNNQSIYHKKFKNNSTGKFSKALRQTNLQNNLKTPGVGQYNIQLKQNEKGVVFSKNFKKILDQNNPGPGQYDNKLESITKKGFKFNKFADKIKNIQSPGPGSYDFFKSFKKSQTFAKQNRILHKENFYPGPGAYQQLLREKVKMGVIAKDSNTDKLEQKPGPADYNLPPTIPLVAPYSYKKQAKLFLNKHILLIQKNKFDFIMEKEFLNLLKSPEDSQMQMEENSFNLSETAEIKEKSFEIEEDDEDIIHFEIDASEQQSFVEVPPNKKIKRQRGNKKDDFDYNNYINEELNQYKTQNMSKREVKRLVQKIRNRKSAQRSRLRQKQAMNYLEYENMNLKDENNILQQKINQLEKELKNSKIQMQKNKLEKNSCVSIKKNSESTENETESHKFSKFNSPTYKRNEIPQQGFLQTKPILFVLGLIMIFCLFQHKEPQYSNLVKIGGFSSLAPIKSKLNFRRRLNNMRKQKLERSKSRTDQEEENTYLKNLKEEVKQQSKLTQYQKNKKQNKRFKNLKQYVDNCLEEEGPKINMCEQEM